jgi:N-glycosylase/DNA lyase
MRLELEIEPLDLAQTLGCGQTFRWRPAEDGSWVGPLDGQLVTLRQDGSRLFVKAVPGGRGVRELVETHLRKCDDVEGVRKALGRDPVLAHGLDKYSGLRIVKLEEWECLCSFALATYANIPRISKMIETLASRFGKKIAGNIRAFPTIERMKRVSIAELSGCGLGYRAQYIHDMSQMLDRDRIDRLTRLGYEELRNELIQLPGVGDKVADCVALFGFGQLESFPIDVWMMRALKRLYGQSGSYGKLRAFAHARFGPCAGYAQEYLYYNERAHASRGACAFSR